MLEHHADALAAQLQLGFRQSGEFLLAQRHRAAIRTLQQVEATNQGTFTGPRAADDAVDFSGSHLQADIVQCGDAAAFMAEMLAEIAYFYHTVCVLSPALIRQKAGERRG